MTSHRSVTFGYDDALFSAGQKTPITWFEEFSTNAHMLVAGKSGTGKTFTLKRIVNQMIRPLPGRVQPRVYIFDVAGDIRFENESRVLFSESTPFGINPLKPSPDPHYGGVRKCVQSFIDMINESAPRSQLGVRQVASLRNLLYELFESRGFRVDDPSTWAVDDDGEAVAGPDGRIYLDVPFDEREVAKSAARAEGVVFQFCSERRSWWCSSHVGGLQRWPTKISGRRAPTLPDAARFLAAKLKMMQVGTSAKCVRLLEEHNKKVLSWQRLIRRHGAAASTNEDVEALKIDIQESSGELIETFSNYVLSIDTGQELESLIRYESLDILKSLADRLDTLVSSGIFRARRPKFDPSASVWTCDISPLRDSEQKLFVWTSLQQIFEQAKEDGLVDGASEVRTVIVLDEAHKFSSEKEGNIIDIISREARKFGVSLICASQAPSHFSEDFLGNVGTKILLGLDPQYHDQTVRKMRIDPKILDYVVAGKIAAVQISDKRDMAHKFKKTRVGN